MEFVFHVINTILFFIMLGVSFNLVLGFTGLVSMAHAAMFGLGAYTAAITAVKLGLPYPVTLVAGVLLTVLVAGFIALPALRVRGEYLILMTIALQLLVYNLALSWVELTNGRTGISGIPRPNLFGFSLSTPTEFFPLVLMLTILCFSIAHRIGLSPYGRVLKAIREDEAATLALGKNVVGYKVTVFVVAAALAAIAGSTFAHYQSFFSPFSVDLHASIFIVAIVVLGGTANLYGTVLGSVLLVGLPEALRFLRADQEIVDALRTLIYGVMLVLFMRFRPEGLIPEYRLPRRKVAGQPEEPLEPAVADLVLSGQTAAAANGEVLRTVALSKSFGGIRAASDLHVTLKHGQITALVGPNGAGKTTVFNLLTGFLPPDEGQVILNGQDISKLPAWRRAQLGLARSFQDVRLFERMSVLDNVMVAIPNHPGERLLPLFLTPRLVKQTELANREKAMAYLRFVGLADKADQLVSSLSYGEQKLLALARLLATEAQVLLLDEPAAGVDIYWVNRILELLRQLTAAGKTVCIVEHNLEVVTAVADRAYFLDVGRIIAEGTPSDLMADQRLTEIYFGATGASTT